LLLCSYYAHFMIEKTLQTRRGTNIPPTGSSLSLLHRWSECYFPDAGRCFSKFSQLTLSNLFAATWRFTHATCYYSGIMLKCFWLAMIPILCSA